MDSGTQRLELCMHTECRTFGEILPGWNTLIFGSDYEWLINAMCNEDVCYDGIIDDSFDFDKDVMPVYVFTSRDP